MSASTTSYCLIMTVQPAQRDRGVTALATFSRVIDVPAGMTRGQLFDDACEYVAGQLRDKGLPGGHNVLFYSLEPNDL